MKNVLEMIILTLVDNKEEVGIMPSVGFISNVTITINYEVLKDILETGIIDKEKAYLFNGELKDLAEDGYYMANTVEYASRIAWPDQDIINIACKGKVGFLPLNYISYPYMMNLLSLPDFKSDYSREKLYDSIINPFTSFLISSECLVLCKTSFAIRTC